MPSPLLSWSIGRIGRLRKFNFDMTQAGAERRLQLSELEELRNEAYESAKIYKARTKHFHDQHIVRKQFEPGQKVWLYQFASPSFSREAEVQMGWTPFIVHRVFPHGAIDLLDPRTGSIFKVNGQRLKPYISDIVVKSRH